MKTIVSGIRNALFWSYERGTWQYDALVIAIIATVFFVPGSYFGDRDRPLKTLTPDVARRWVIPPAKIETFAQKSGTVEKLKSDPREVVQLYLREVISQDVELGDFKVETDNRGRIVGYNVGFKQRSNPDGSTVIAAPTN